MYEIDQKDREVLQVADNVTTKLAEVLIKTQSSNEVVFLASSKILMSSVEAMRMPPDIFLRTLCSLYRQITGIEIRTEWSGQIPRPGQPGMGLPNTEPPKDPTKLN